jgi:hypothetical protein
MSDTAHPRPIRLERRSPSYWRVTFDHPPLNIFGPKTIPPSNEIITALDTDAHVKVVVFDSAVERFCVTHYDFLTPVVHETVILGPLPLSRPVYVFHERELIRRCRRYLRPMDSARAILCNSISRRKNTRGRMPKRSVDGERKEHAYERTINPDTPPQPSGAHNLAAGAVHSGVPRRSGANASGHHTTSSRIEEHNDGHD